MKISSTKIINANVNPITNIKRGPLKMTSNEISL